MGIGGIFCKKNHNLNLWVIKSNQNEVRHVGRRAYPSFFLNSFSRGPHNQELQQSQFRMNQCHRAYLSIIIYR